MHRTYYELVQQTFEWPKQDFDLDDKGLTFHGISLGSLAAQYGTPLRLTYLPKIGQKVDEARHLFQDAMYQIDYPATYTPCYCTKSSHFSFVLNEAIDHGAHLETSSAFDLDIMTHLIARGRLSKDTFIICNGFKPDSYVQRINDLLKAGYRNMIPVLDNREELYAYKNQHEEPIQLGMRLATEEEPQFEFYTSRLGMTHQGILELYREHIQQDPNLQVKLLHFFVNTGIRDEAYYWNELTKAVNCYCDLKAECPELNTLDIGGGFPVPQSIDFQYDYAYMARQIIKNIKDICSDRGIDPPHIFTEFGQYTVAESGAILMGVIGEKQQNDAETWYIIDNSILGSLPDAWGIGERFILLPVNHWNEPYQRINIGGLTCDSMDYYNAEIHERQVFLPKNDPQDPLVIGFFYTGAYQENLGGYGGLKHCLIPDMQHLLVDEDEQGELQFQLFKPQQSSDEMLRLLGYSTG